jgi:predicted NUDIX family NTP pyrophosphohydrolase
MPKLSAGLLLFRRLRREGGPEVLLGHMGGPFWAGKEQGAWSIPKGLPLPGEDLLAAARREVKEETGLEPPGPFLPLRPIRQAGGKEVHAWAAETDCDPAQQPFPRRVAAPLRPVAELPRARPGRLADPGRRARQDRARAGGPARPA